ncbi:MAG: 2-oxoacid:acceptor oxidoreductase family protein [Betaproteobacteria bacterium]
MEGTLDIRFESIGGLGADTAAQALAAAAVLDMGLNGAYLGPPPPERRGARGRSSVQLTRGDRAIRLSAAVERPDAVVLFHPALLRDPSIFAGLRKGGTFLFNATARFDADTLSPLPSTARAIRVDAAGIAAKEQASLGAVILGALCDAFPFLEADKVFDRFCAMSQGVDEAARGRLRKAFDRGAAEAQEIDGAGEAEGDVPPAKLELAWEADAHGGLIEAAGSSAWNDLSSARSGSLPAFNRERCIHCALCDMVCPDGCLVWEQGEPGGRFERELTGVDYRYCKGCLRCVESCPASAMLKKAETAGFAEQRCVPLFPDLVE